jgi:hypothetical protein
LKRLPGVIVSAVLLIIGSLFQLLMAVLMGFGAFLQQRGLQHAANPSLPAQPALPVQPAWLPWFSAAIAAVVVGLAVWGFLTSAGLFRMRRWARYSVLIIGGCLAGFGVPAMLMTIVISMIPLPAPAGVDPAHAHTAQLAVKIVFLAVSLFYAAISAIGIWWLVYFNRRAVREAFNGAPGAPLPSRRPILISVLAVLNFIGAPMCALLVLVPIPFAMFGVIVHGWAKVVTLLVFAVSVGVAGVGLWRLQEWGRRTAIALQVVGLVNSMIYVVRPSVMQQYQAEINRSMGITQSPVLPPQFQTSVQTASLALGMIVVLAVIAILHYYRDAFKEPSGPSQAQLELMG